MVYFFTRDVFRYSPLSSGGGRTSRIATFINLSVYNILAVALTLLSVATAAFFVGRLSLTESNQTRIHRELDLTPTCHESAHNNATDTSLHEAGGFSLQQNLWGSSLHFQ